MLIFSPSKPKDMSTPRFHTLKIADIRKETADTVSIAFEVPESLKQEYRFQPGQYLTLKHDIQNEEIRRSYSICTEPAEGELRVAVKEVPGGVFSTYANNELKRGEYLEVMTPAGRFTPAIEATNAKHYVLFAAGSGITPIISIAKTVLRSEPNSTVTLFYGNKNITSIIFREELEALKNKFLTRFNLVHVLSREFLGVDLQKGRIDAAKCDQLYNSFLKNATIDEVFICGPEEMILSVKDKMIGYGVAEAKVHFELFTTSTPVVKSTANEPRIEANVTVILDGVELEIRVDSDGENILDAAYKAGADVPFACKGGVCCTCKAKVLAGTAKMDVNYALEPDEIENGYILTCQAHPTSEKLVVSFDD
jgi:ring-1,2-phenylacetyl-CoA epoxidase subunit PaaE